MRFQIWSNNQNFVNPSISITAVPFRVRVATPNLSGLSLKQELLQQNTTHCGPCVCLFLILSWHHPGDRCGCHIIPVLIVLVVRHDTAGARGGGGVPKK